MRSSRLTNPRRTVAAAARAHFLNNRSGISPAVQNDRTPRNAMASWLAKEPVQQIAGKKAAKKAQKFKNAAQKASKKKAQKKANKSKRR